MPVLDRRVQILFDAERYEALVALARQEGQSVGATVRALVDERLARVSHRRAAALDSLIASWDEKPSAVADWDEVKASFD
jgi:hypothetical protein